MIHPSYVELMKRVNDHVVVGEEPVVNSRYSIVCATAKRAREIIDGAEPINIKDADKKKALSIAVEELYNGDLKILSDEEIEQKDKELANLKEDLSNDRYAYEKYLNTENTTVEA
ncbi:MAG: DNA-directed RNA polymerase subunit omega [Lachnospiraceae bacterium]|nr:DNA-directed RNA polymerase subunit omega [Lachnospiraceae bacterium]